MGLAARMMEKMGWKEGQGLGRARQGMVTPLVAQKTDARSGVIVNAAEDRGAGPPEKRPSTGARSPPPARAPLRPRLPAASAGAASGARTARAVGGALRRPRGFLTMCKPSLIRTAWRSGGAPRMSGA